MQGALGDPNNDMVHLISWGSVFGMGVCLLLIGIDCFRDIHSVPGFIKFVIWAFIAAVILVPAATAFHWGYDKVE